MVSMIKIADDVREVLSRSTTSGKVLTLPAELDRKIYTSVDKVLKVLGGKWTKKLNGHVFDKDASVVLAFVLGKEGIVDTKKTYQVFETPNATADMVASAFMNKLWKLSLPKRILEPSAGTGQLLTAVERWCETVKVKTPIAHAIDIQKELLDKLGERPLKMEVWPTVGDFLSFNLNNFATHRYVKFDGVIMNPPFTKGQDIEHVMHAMKFVKPRGVLTAVISPSYEHNETKKYKLFRAWLEQFKDIEIEYLPEGSFKESGTNVRTVLITIQKGD